MKRLFIGNIDNGTEELDNNNTITAPSSKWFGDLKEGDWTFVSEKGSQIDKLLEFKHAENIEEEVRYHFEVIKRYEPQKAKVFIDSKYFELDIVTFNNALKSAGSSKNSHFFPLRIRERYKHISADKMEFSEENMRSLYVTEDLDNIINKKDGDIFIIVSDQNDGYKIKEVVEYNEGNIYRNINLKDFSYNINIEDYGFVEAYKIEEEKIKKSGKKRPQKKNLLLRILKDLESENGYYKLPMSSNFSNFYNILIVKEGVDKLEENEPGDEFIEEDEYLNDEDETYTYNEEKGKNIIIYGVPGSGKSYYIKKILKNVGEEYKERVIFYPEYSYYDFVGQKVPNKDGGLTFEEGNFTRILRKALSEKHGKQYYLIIEEMNRGNAEAIFGDIFQLLDRKENGKSEYTINNSNLIEYLNEKLDKPVDRIYIPNNLTIYATINNADQNVFNFDTAFGRRWEYRMMPCNSDEFNKDESPNKIFSKGYIKGTDIKWNEFRVAINKVILDNKEEIYNAEEKRLGLYYIDEECLSINPNEEDSQILEKFASKIFRYLYLNVFKNNVSKIFNNSDKKILEDYIIDFKTKKIDEILAIEIKNNEARENEE